jgi:hypothetical protein
MTAFDDLSIASADLIFFALDYAVKNAAISEEGFTPFAVQAGRSGRGLTRFVAGDGSDLAECLAAGREALVAVEPDVTCVALAWDGYHTNEDRRSEAVFVEGYEVGRDAGVLQAQRYTRGSDGLVLEGNPKLVGEPTPLVRSRRRAG